VGKNLQKKKGGINVPRIKKKRQEQFVKPWEAGNILGVSRHTIYRWIRQGRLTGYKTPGGRLMVSREEVEKLYKEVDKGEKNKH